MAELRADARRNREELLDVARQVIAEEGTEASLRDIARRAGVGIGTLYRHFPTREALLSEVLGEILAGARANGELLLAEAAPDEAVVQWLERFVQGAAR